MEKNSFSQKASKNFTKKKVLKMNLKDVQNVEKQERTETMIETTTEDSEDSTVSGYKPYKNDSYKVLFFLNPK